MTEVSFRSLCANVSTDAIDAMCANIDAAIEKRDASANNGGGSWLDSRKRLLASKSNVARFFVALNVKAENVLLRSVVSNALFNAKALKKVVELANFACNGSKQVEKVMSSFVICSLRFSAMNDENNAISNAVNKAFLSSQKFDDIVKDAELAAYLADYQHTFMSGGRDTQSSQARNVLDVLNLGEIVACDNRYRGGIKINADHAFFSDFCDAFLKA